METLTIRDAPGAKKCWNWVQFHVRDAQHLEKDVT